MRRKKPGRRSMAELAVTQLAGPVDRVDRLPPPDELLVDEELAEWRALTEAMPADYFRREHQALLAQLARHIVASNRISAMMHRLETAETWDVEKWLICLKEQRAESKSIAQLASKLRLAHVSVMRQDRTAPPPSGKEPWLK